MLTHSLGISYHYKNDVLSISLGISCYYEDDVLTSISRLHPKSTKFPTIGVNEGLSSTSYASV